MPVPRVRAPESVPKRRRQQTVSVDACPGGCQTQSGKKKRTDGRGSELATPGRLAADARSRRPPNARLSCRAACEDFTPRKERMQARSTTFVLLGSRILWVAKVRDGFEPGNATQFSGPGSRLFRFNRIELLRPRNQLAVISDFQPKNVCLGGVRNCCRRIRVTPNNLSPYHSRFFDCQS